MPATLDTQTRGARLARRLSAIRAHPHATRGFAAHGVLRRMAGMTLEAEGCEYIFGVPGEENLDFLDSLSRSERIKLVLTRHEQGAGFMAATYGRHTGRTGVCLATLGPGATIERACEPKRLIAYVAFKNVRRGALVKRRWRMNGNLVKATNVAWDHGRKRRVVRLVIFNPRTLPHGRYKIAIRATGAPRWAVGTVKLAC